MLRMRGLDEILVIRYITQMDLQKVINNSKQFVALTTLHIEEFEEFLLYFSSRWHQFIKHFNFRDKRRTKPLTGAQIENATVQGQSLSSLSARRCSFIRTF